MEEKRRAKKKDEYRKFSRRHGTVSIPSPPRRGLSAQAGGLSNSARTSILDERAPAQPPVREPRPQRLARQQNSHQCAGILIQEIRRGPR